MTRAGPAGRRPTWRSTWRQRPRGRRRTPPSTRTAGSALRPSTTSSASSARPGYTRWRPLTTILYRRLSASTCSGCLVPTELMSEIDPQGPIKAAPFEDLRVLAVEQFGAGPFGTLQLADLGATVIK